ncbi:hypothetical protein OKW46_003434 [Paraburkholderia sp. WSM4179]|nr:hypothetical protein [Paraburkholderia sp. WSM4179]
MKIADQRSAIESLAVQDTLSAGDADAIRTARRCYEIGGGDQFVSAAGTLIPPVSPGGTPAVLSVTYGRRVSVRARSVPGTRLVPVWAVTESDG